MGHCCSIRCIPVWGYILFQFFPWVNFPRFFGELLARTRWPPGPPVPHDDEERSRPGNWASLILEKIALLHTHAHTHTHLQHLVIDISLPVDFVRRFREKLCTCKPAIFLGITPAQSSVTPHVYLPVVRRQTQVGLRADAFPACLDCNHISNQKAQVKSPQCEQESQQ